MSQRPELELIDQLEGEPLSLEAAVKLFADREHALRVLQIYVSKGIVRVSRAGEPGSSLREWEIRELCRQPLEGGVDPLRVELTPKGARLWETGKWDQM